MAWYLPCVIIRTWWRRLSWLIMHVNSQQNYTTDSRSLWRSKMYYAITSAVRGLFIRVWLCRGLHTNAACFACALSIPQFSCMMTGGTSLLFCLVAVASVLGFLCNVHVFVFVVKFYRSTSSATTALFTLLSCHEVNL